MEANQLSVEFLFDPLAYLKGSTALTDKICIFWLSKTITLCNCHPDLELFGCQGNIAGDNLIAAANCISSSPDAKPVLPEMPALGLGYFIFRKQGLEKLGYLQPRRYFLLKLNYLGNLALWAQSTCEAAAQQQRVLLCSNNGATMTLSR